MLCSTSSTTLCSNPFTAGVYPKTNVFLSHHFTRNKAILMFAFDVFLRNPSDFSPRLSGKTTSPVNPVDVYKKCAKQVSHQQ